MYSNDVRAREHGSRHRRRRPPVALERGPAAGGLAQKRLPRRPHENRPIERSGQLRQPRQHTIAVGRPFGKPDPRVEDDPLDGDSGIHGNLNAGLKLAAHVLDDVVVHRFGIHLPGAAARMHQDQRRARSSDRWSELGVVAETADVVDDCGSGLCRRPSHLGFVGIDRDWNPQLADQPANDWQDAREFLLRRHRGGARTCRLAADVDEVGAVSLHAQRRVDG